ncbi:hypothetical protein KBT16_02110 [Nostoc sp. CCCryo 231-06]|nr:hypothetical protein [Nostoc sp. CCCryo 231-06]
MTTAGIAFSQVEVGEYTLRWCVHYVNGDRLSQIIMLIFLEFSRRQILFTN